MESIRTDPESTHLGWEAQKGIKPQNPLKQVMETFGITLEELRSGSRRQHLVDARSLVAALLMQQPFTRQQDVAELLGISQAAVSHLLVRHNDLLHVDPKYQRKWEKVSNQKNDAKTTGTVENRRVENTQQPHSRSSVPSAHYDPPQSPQPHTALRLCGVNRIVCRWHTQDSEKYRVKSHKSKIPKK